MRPFRIDRRTLLRGTGSVAVALPWLEAMEPLKPARAQVANAERFVAVYHPSGTTLDQFRPTGTERDFQMGPILQPLAGMRDHLTVFEGLDMQCRSGEQDQAGMVAWLTGRQQDLSSHTPGPSLDLPLLDLLGGDLLYLAVRWATHPSAAGAPDFTNAISYRVAGGEYVPQQPAIDPVVTWQKLFGALGESSGSQAWQKSILDGVLERFAKLSQRVGARDRHTLEQHMQSLRELELGVAAQCRPPELVDTPGYDAEAFGMLAPGTDAAIPAVGKLMMDMLVMALSCDISRVALFQWVDSHAAYTLPWLNLPEVQNYYEHNGGYQPEEMTQIFSWYSEQHRYLIDEMARVEASPGRSLLDVSVLFFGTHLQHPATHDVTDMPFFLAGHGGGLAGNRYRKYSSRPHNDLLVSILNLFGDSSTTFGDPMFNTGALDLTS